MRSGPLIASFLASVTGLGAALSCASPPPPPPSTSRPTPTASAPTTPTQGPESGSKPGAPAAPPVCKSLPGWRYERIDLPPEFAPSLPPGVEVLWFAPGMFKPDAPDYFTYAFSVAWKDAPPADRDALAAWLRTYYEGLMTAVASGNDRTVARPVEVTIAEDRASGTVATSDEFTGGTELEIALRIGGNATCSIFYATGRPTEDNWAALQAADACLCELAP